MINIITNDEKSHRKYIRAKVLFCTFVSFFIKNNDEKNHHKYYKKTSKARKYQEYKSGIIFALLNKCWKIFKGV